MTLQLPSARPLYDGFPAFHAREIAPYLREREVERQQAVTRLCAATGAGVAGAVALSFSNVFGPGNFNIATFLVFGGFFFGLMLLDRTRDDITHGLLEKVASKFGFAYRGKLDRPALYEQFRRLKLLPDHNREEFEDEVRGEYAGAPFTLCEAHLYMKRSSKSTKGQTVFHGQLVVIDYPKRFLGSTVLLRDAGALNALTKPAKEYQRVGLASPAFEKSFEAWSTDQVEARDLLDPIVLERFQELERLFGGKKLRAAFDGGKLLIAIETGDRLSIGTMFKPIEGTARIEIILKEFDVIFDLIDVLLVRLEKRTAGAFSIADVKPRLANNG
ncbi:MAG: DUF3137 domain-containing protein [Parvularculaceae bacterium]|nr:DUF3137 domain-containing protein [Parvularculaceae bacterium]